MASVLSRFRSLRIFFRLSLACLLASQVWASSGVSRVSPIIIGPLAADGPPFHGLRGHVKTDSIFDPVAGATVRLIGVLDNNAYSTTAITGKDGGYEIKLPDGIAGPVLILVVVNGVAQGAPATATVPAGGLVVDWEATGPAVSDRDATIAKAARDRVVERLPVALAPTGDGKPILRTGINLDSISDARLQAIARAWRDPAGSRKLWEHFGKAPERETIDGEGLGLARLSYEASWDAASLSAAQLFFVGGLPPPRENGRYSAWELILKAPIQLSVGPGSIEPDPVGANSYYLRWDRAAMILQANNGYLIQIYVYGDDPEILAKARLVQIYRQVPGEFPTKPEAGGSHGIPSR